MDVNVDTYTDAVRRHDQRIHSFLEFDPTRRAERTDAEGRSAAAVSTGAIAGLPFAVKDNLAVAGFNLTCGSRILGEFRSPYDATVVKRLMHAGATPVGKTNMDEFGMGSSGDMSAFGATNNPWNTAHVAGGSSGGSAAAVAAGFVPFALGSDTGGSVRQPASFCGVYGLKPTYGALSRYGLVAYASSLEVVGLLAPDLPTLRGAFAAAAGLDELDQTTVAHEEPAEQSRGGAPDPAGAPGTVAVLDGELGLTPEVRAAYDHAIEVARDAGYRIAAVTLKNADYYVPVYYTIAVAEASANLARFNGIRYGQRPIFSESPEQLIRNARAQGFGDEVKLRIVVGTYVLRSGFQDQYYQRAQRIRTAIRAELDDLWAGHRMLMLPVFPTPAFAHGEPSMDSFQQKMADRFTSVANLAASPALAFPVSVSHGLPVGMQVMGPRFSEPALMHFAAAIAERLPPERAPGYEPHWRPAAGSRA